MLTVHQVALSPAAGATQSLLRCVSVPVGGASTAVAIVAQFGGMGRSAHCRLGPYIFEKLAFTVSASIRDESKFAGHLARLLPVGSPHCKLHREGRFVRAGAIVPRIDRSAVQLLLRDVLVDAPTTPPPALAAMLAYDASELQRRQPEQYVVELGVRALYRDRVFSLALDADPSSSAPSSYPQFVANLVQPDRAFVLAVGPDADSLPDIVRDVIGDEPEGIVLPPASSSLEEVVDDGLAALGSGREPGIIEESAEAQEHAFLGLFVPALPPSDALYAAQLVLHSLLGGGGSFSAGGPGKGMFSRLYAGVLSRHHFVESMRCVLSEGLFGIVGSSLRDYSPSLLNVMQEQWASMGDSVTNTELARARQQAAGAVLMAGEQRLGLVDQLALSVLGGARAPQPHELADHIRAVSGKDLEAVRDRLLADADPQRRSHSAYVAFGRLPTTLPQLSLP